MGALVVCAAHRSFAFLPALSGLALGQPVRVRLREVFLAGLGFLRHAVAFINHRHLPRLLCQSAQCLSVNPIPVAASPRAREAWLTSTKCGRSVVRFAMVGLSAPAMVGGM
ncbi:hypothetical protein D3C76_1167590 [compost metagenome]